MNFCFSPCHSVLYTKAYRYIFSVCWSFSRHESLILPVSSSKVELIIRFIIFVTIINGANVPSVFSFILLEEFLIGMVVALFVFLSLILLISKVESTTVYTIVIRAFLYRDETNSKMFLPESRIIEEMVRKTMSVIQTRLQEAPFEPSRFFAASVQSTTTTNNFRFNCPRYAQIACSMANNMFTF